MCSQIHLSNDTNHDSIMTFSIPEDILAKFPQILEGEKLIMRSDNASTQYKSRFAFALMHDLVEKYNIDIFCFFGEAGHGCGLIDAMSSFGCKASLRQAIFNNYWFHNAAEMVAFLIDEFKDDPAKSYHIIEEKATAEKRRLVRKEFPIKGCRQMHLIS